MMSQAGERASRPKVCKAHLSDDIHVMVMVLKRRMVSDRRMLTAVQAMATMKAASWLGVRRAERWIT